MSKEKATIYDLWRVCKYYDGYCEECPLRPKACGFGSNTPLKEVDESNDIILKWRKEQPVKTRQDKFLELFPNAKLNSNGIVDICPRQTNGHNYNYGRCSYGDGYCWECKKSYWLAEVEE